ncbi:ligand-binding sensor domain-containing protein [Flaviaesturariibacter amylovorans]|uniref:Histidine kinase n=1 Tax=Flaviaesturariibacter amylovorans TaxID=1084520 RepID=A0ABP8G594_9BACT
MKQYSAARHLLTILAILLLGTACQEPAKNGLPDKHPKLIKTIGNPGYGNVQCSLEDKAGNLWFGTTGNGLYRYDGKSFRQFLMADGLNSNSVYALMEDNEGRIWVGTEAGLCLYKPAASTTPGGNAFDPVRIPLPKDLPPNTNPNKQNAHLIHSMLQAKSGKLWFATIDGVFVSDGQSFTHFPIREAPNGYLGTNDKAERLLEDKAGNIWFGGRTNEGAYRYDGKTVTQLRLDTLFQDGPTPKPHNWGWPQVQDRAGNIWFSSWGGAYRYDGKSVTGFTREAGLPNEVTCILEDKKGNLWFGGAQGLARYDGKTFTRFGTKDGLANPWIWSLLEDTRGHIWVGTRATGLYLFDGTRFIAYSEYQQPVAK